MKPTLNNPVPRADILFCISTNQYWESILMPALFSEAMIHALDNLAPGLPPAVSESLSLLLMKPTVLKPCLISC